MPCLQSLAQGGLKRSTEERCVAGTQFLLHIHDPDRGEVLACCRSRECCVLRRDAESCGLIVQALLVRKDAVGKADEVHFS